MVKISEKKMTYYRKHIRGVGEFLIKASYSDSYVRAVILNNRYLGAFEKELRALVKPEQ